jgi:7-carboxy-7-deazaguanine synthase
MTESTLVVSEVFGPTFQGEGPSCGRRAGFIRLMGCNLTCSWCDTPYTWDASRFDLHKEGKRMTVAQIVERVSEGGPELAVISGGEPLLHQRQEAWVPLLDGLAKAGLLIEVETNGTQEPDLTTQDRISRFNVSPKLAHGGDELDKRFKPAVLRTLAMTGSAIFKFVVRDAADLDEVAELIDRAQISDDLVWIMPEGTTAAVISQRLAELAGEIVERGWNVTTRLHVLAYGDKRGV